MRQWRQNSKHFNINLDPEDGGNTFFRNVGTLLSDCVTSQTLVFLIFIITYYNFLYLHIDLKWAPLLISQLASQSVSLFVRLLDGRGKRTDGGTGRLDR
jgi:Kef-type K+ transport system membrane component KefB